MKKRMPEDLNKVSQCGENLGKQSWLTEGPHSASILASVVLLKTHCLELSKLIFAGFLFCFIHIIFVTKQNKNPSN